MLAWIVENYQLLVNNIGQLIEISGYRNDFLSQKIGLKPANFSLKKQKGNWSAEEILKLLAIIENKEIKEYVEDLRMKESMNNGKFISSGKFEKQMGWK